MELREKFDKEVEGVGLNRNVKDQSFKALFERVDLKPAQKEAILEGAKAAAKITLLDKLASVVMHLDGELTPSFQKKYFELKDEAMTEYDIAFNTYATF